MNSKAGGDNERPTTIGNDDASAASTKPKPKRKLKRKANDDPFVSDENDDEGQVMQSKMASTKFKGQGVADDGEEQK